MKRTASGVSVGWTRVPSKRNRTELVAFPWRSQKAPINFSSFVVRLILKKTSLLLSVTLMFRCSELAGACSPGVPFSFSLDIVIVLLKQLCARGENVSARSWDEWKWEKGGVARCYRSHTVPFHDGGRERSVLVSGGDDRVTVLHFQGVVESNGNRSGALLKRKCYVSGELLTELGAGEKKEKEWCWWEA